MMPIGMPITTFQSKKELISVIIDVLDGKSLFILAHPPLMVGQLFAISRPRKKFFIATSVPIISYLYETMTDLSYVEWLLILILVQSLEIIL
jgi:hypothetical protein